MRCELLVGLVDVILDRAADTFDDTSLNGLRVVYLLVHSIYRPRAKEEWPVGALAQLVRQIVHALARIFIEALEFDGEQSLEAAIIHFARLSILDVIKGNATQRLNKEALQPWSQRVNIACTLDSHWVTLTKRTHIAVLRARIQFPFAI